MLALPLQEPFWRDADSGPRIRVTLPDSLNHILAYISNPRLLANAAAIWASRRSDDFDHPRGMIFFALYERLPSGIWVFRESGGFSSFQHSEREATGDSSRQVRGTSPEMRACDFVQFLYVPMVFPADSGRSGHPFRRPIRHSSRAVHFSH